LLKSRIGHLNKNTVPQAVSDLPLCVAVLKCRDPLARGGVGDGATPCQKLFYEGILLMCISFKFEVLFRSNSRHNDRVDSLWERATKQAVMTVIRWHKNQIIKGPLVIGKKC